MLGIGNGPSNAHLQTDPRFQSLDEAPLRTISRQINFSRRQQKPVHPDILRAKRLAEERRALSLARSGQIPFYRLGIAKNPQKHYLYKGITAHKAEEHEALADRNEISFVNNLISQTSPDSIVGIVNTNLKRFPSGGSLYTSSKDNIHEITAGQYYNLLTQNQPLPRGFVKLLEAIDSSENNSNQCAGLGSFCERRVGLVLSRLQDAGFIRNFKLFGEAALPLTIPSSKIESDVNYNAGEEAMAIDVMVELDSPEAYQYAPLQIKAQGGEGFRDGNGAEVTKKYLSFNKNQLKELIELQPEVQDFFVPDTSTEGKYHLCVKRDIFTISAENRVLYKMSYADNRPDIANFLIAAFEHMVNRKKVLSLDRPYEDLSYPQRISALINAGFLQMEKIDKVEEKPKEPSLIL